MLLASRPWSRSRSPCMLQARQLKNLCLLSFISGVMNIRAHPFLGMAAKRPVERTDAKYKVLAFGDSLTEGFHSGGFAFHPYSIKLSELLTKHGHDVKVYERGNSGEQVIGGMDHRLPSLIALFKRNNMSLDWVVILGGINDLGYGGSPEDVYDGLRALYMACHENGARVLALTCLQTAFSPGDVPDNRKRLNDLIRSTPSTFDFVTVLDMDKLLPFPRTSADPQAMALWDDGLHLTPAGYDRMGEIVYEALKDKLE